MCDGSYSQLTGCPCIPRPPLTGCVQESMVLPTLRSDEANEVRDVCHEVILAVHRLKDIIDTQSDEHMVSRRYIDVMSMVAELTKAVITYMEPEDGGKPY